MNYLPAGGAVGAGELEVSLVTVTLDTNQSSRGLEFVTSQIQENNFGIKKKNEISPFGVDFEICNFVDRLCPNIHTTH